ncbi:CDGSH iron-sulfur domain-containing protein [Streptomyces sp. NPDC059456]|uniref:CDGSH iron-sulfur domain-containing protein n=1 Tax=Streptomyces sp. NPDC059456 TaxID=3346838 RepID=UPI0036C209AC
MPGTSDTAAAGASDPECAAPPPARRVFVDPQGPVVVEGPVEITLADGAVVRSDRFMVAVCTCRPSRTYPWCDTIHRRRARGGAPPPEPEVR